LKKKEKENKGKASMNGQTLTQKKERYVYFEANENVFYHCIVFFVVNNIIRNISDAAIMRAKQEAALAKKQADAAAGAKK
jgi:hypothetical protein